MQALGRIEGRLDGIEKHTEAVSAKATRIESKLDTHIGSDDAHGARTERRVWGHAGKVLLGLASLMGLVVAVYKAVHG